MKIELPIPLFYESYSGEHLEFQLTSPFQPSGDQPEAIKTLTKGLNCNEKNQVLLGVTGSGKTYTMAQVIQQVQKPTLILAPNKILAAQLHAEMQAFFPKNAVEYFVSYYDYYQPEAYVPRTDTFIEKTSSINEQIDRMRHAATRALLEQRDVIVVASVSCIYGIGSVNTYSAMIQTLKKGEFISLRTISQRLTELQYKRNDIDFSRGAFRIRGDILEIFPSHYKDRAWRISFFGDFIERIIEIDSLTGERFDERTSITIFPNSHYVVPGPTRDQAIKEIYKDLTLRLAEFKEENKLLEYQRLEQRIRFDIEMLAATGFCNGIENYSRYFSGRQPGEPPPTLFEYLPKDALLIVDESHVAVPQLNAMYRGDRARKIVLSEHGFRLPSCLDNRPLKFEEWDQQRPQTIFVSATPGPWELEKAQGVFAEQLIRPTGLVDPICHVRPCAHQVDDLIQAAKETALKGYRTLVTTLTKKMAEALTEYLNEAGLSVRYLHSDVETLERIEIIQSLRRGEYQVLVGINLLREGLDIPECGLVAILDADKEGFLRSKTSLIQTIGRAARNADGQVILYADRITGSMKAALDETTRRRDKQISYNTAHGIVPQTIQKSVAPPVFSEKQKKQKLDEKTFQKRIDYLKKEMHGAAADLDFERAAELRDEISQLESEALVVL